MAELVDARDLKSLGEILYAGSSPALGIKNQFMKKIQNLMKITKSAKNYLSSLKEEEKINFRISTKNPGTLNADILLTFCSYGEEKDSDFSINFKKFILYIDQSSKDFLKKSLIDFKNGELSISAPNLKKFKKEKNQISLKNRIQFFIESKINPGLKSHNGRVDLIDLHQNQILIQFSGGCHGCSLSNKTLKENIEKLIQNQFSEIEKIIDITDHSKGKNPYFKKEIL